MKWSLKDPSDVTIQLLEEIRDVKRREREVIARRLIDDEEAAELRIATEEDERALQRSSIEGTKRQQLNGWLAGVWDQKDESDRQQRELIRQKEEHELWERQQNELREQRELEATANSIALKILSDAEDVIESTIPPSRKAPILVDLIHPIPGVSPPKVLISILYKILSPRLPHVQLSLTSRSTIAAVDQFGTHRYKEPCVRTEFLVAEPRREFSVMESESFGNGLLSAPSSILTL